MELKKPVSNAGDGSGGQAPEAPREDAPPGEEKPRVVDRRRVRPDGDAQAEDTGDEGEAGGRYPTFVEELQRKVDVAEEKLHAHIERVNKESAEFRARQERDLERRTLLARKELVSGFIDVADDLSRASAAALEAKEDPRRREEGFEALVQGVQMIQGRFFQNLAAMGIQPIVSRNVRFDPNCHEAVGVVKVTDSSLDGMVVEEVSQGYMIEEEVLRPSRVRVGRLDSNDGLAE